MSVTVTIGEQEYFKGIGKINYEGPNSRNPLAFKYYDENKVVAGKTIKDHLRASACYWHNFCGDGGDPFGSATKRLPWNEAGDPLDAAKAKLDAAFEFFTKLGVPYWCFHDRDLAPEGKNIEESEKILQTLVELAVKKQQESGVKLLWGTANLFSHPRYMNGASTNPNFEVVCHAAAQVKAAIDATVKLGGQGYVFWGGREGYTCLFNTDTKKELDNMGRFLTLARDYGRKAGFQGTFLIEPKPMEPSTHQYDFDAATVIGFLREHDLLSDFKLNIENNHATLAGHSFAHELRVAADHGLLGSIDANEGNPQNGWDTDEFPYSLTQATEAMLVVLQAGGLGNGGLNFDAKTRRNSTDLEDLFLGHILGLDVFARALMAADAILNQTDYVKLVKERYASFDGGDGKKFTAGKLGLEDLRGIAAKSGEPKQMSGKQELYQAIITNAIK